MSRHVQASTSTLRSTRSLSRPLARIQYRPRPSTSSSSSYSTGSSSRPASRRRAAILGLGTATLTYLTLPTLSSESAPTAMSSIPAPLDSLSAASTPALLRAYLVYTLCSLPALIDHAPTLLRAFSTSPLPLVSTFTNYIVRHTFFAQFVPGETVEECLPEMRALRARGVGAVLNYSAEADEGEQVWTEEEKMAQRRKIEEERLQVVVRALEASGMHEDQVAAEGEARGSTAFALKITGLIDPQILKRASTTLLRLRPLTHSNAPSSPFSPALPETPYPGSPIDADRRIVAPEGGKEKVALLALKGAVESMGVLPGDQGLREGDLEELRVLWGKLRMLGDTAKRHGVKLMIDAEYTYYQPALDAYTLLLSEEFNRPPSSRTASAKEAAEWSGPLIYGTYQSYLTRQPTHLVHAIQHAEKSGYALGIKLVRGAYFLHERKAWKDAGRPGADPIWPDKEATDKAYNTSISTILSTLSAQLAGPYPDRALSVVFGTHNGHSVDLVIQGLEKFGLAVPAGEDRLRLREDVRGKIGIAQLYGMKDDLMDRVNTKFQYDGSPIALKYIAYGSLLECQMFLARRAIENKSLMSGDHGAAAERRRASGEIWRRTRAVVGL